MNASSRIFPFLNFICINKNIFEDNHVNLQNEEAIFKCQFFIGEINGLDWKSKTQMEWLKICVGKKIEL